MNEELKPCPFCGGKAKLSYKWARRFTTKTFAPPLSVMEEYGLDFWCEKHVTITTYHYRVQAICVKCRGRGKPILTHVDEYTPYEKEGRKEYEKYELQAIEAWNRRVEE